MIQIKTNTWYRFNSKAAAETWAAEVYVQYGIVIPSNMFVKECLKINDALEVNFRSYYSEQHPFEHITFYCNSPQPSPCNPVPIETQINDLGGITRMQKLIDRARNRDISQINEEREAMLKSKVRASTTGKAITAAIEQFKQINVNLTFDNVFSCEILTPTEFEDIRRVEQGYEKLISVVYEKYSELQELLKYTDTYEQKLELLRRYNVLEHFDPTGELVCEEN